MSSACTLRSGTLRCASSCRTANAKARLTLPNIEYVREAVRSKQLNATPGPAIIISASGMAESGRILHHLKHNIEDAENTILLVSFMAQDTLGRRLKDGAKRVRIFGEEYDVRARSRASRATAPTPTRPGCCAGQGLLNEID